MISIKILLVEDSRISAKFVLGLLAEGTTETYDVTVAATLAEAMDQLDQHVFDLVLLDLMLPDSSDMDTLDKARAKAPNTAVVVMTASAQTHTAKEALRRGCQDFLIKGSFDGNLLRHVIRYAVERNRMEMELRLKEQRFEDYAEAGADWFWEMGPDQWPTLFRHERGVSRLPRDRHRHLH
ncbi:MAG: response regulator [Alphaproteobacteria bacterium]|nr:response regulator [Alphaproteobacteria bacterium]MBF0249856.1 response regulator [Alphaproteobacteria bacterium]